MSYKSKYLRAKEKYQELLVRNEEMRDEVAFATEETKQLREEIRMLLNTISELDPSLEPDETTEEEFEENKDNNVDNEGEESRRRYKEEERHSYNPEEENRSEVYQEDRNDPRAHGYNNGSRFQNDRTNNNYRNVPIKFSREGSLEPPRSGYNEVNRNNYNKSPIHSSHDVYQDRHRAREAEAFYRNDTRSYPREMDNTMRTNREYPRDSRDPRLDVREQHYDNSLRHSNGGKYPINQRADSSPIDNRYDQPNNGYY